MHLLYVCVNETYSYGSRKSVNISLHVGLDVSGIHTDRDNTFVAISSSEFSSENNNGLT